MRLLRPAVPVLLPVLLLVGACSSDDDGGDGGGGAALDAVEVSAATEEGTAPTLTVDGPLSVTETQTKVITEGDGEAVAEGDLVGVRLVAVNGRDGKALSNPDWTVAPDYFVVGSDQTPPFVAAALEDATVGSQVLTAVPPEEGPQANLADAGVKADDTLVILLDFTSSGSPRAEGTPVTPPAGLPTVALDEATGEPTITVPAGTPAPTELVAQTLIKGSGPVVTADQSVTAQYTGVVYGTGTVFDSSWERGAPSTFPLSGVIAGWTQGLTGQTVGSQVLLVIPPAQGYGDAGQPDAGISGTDTLVFVVDILAAS